MNRCAQIGQEFILHEFQHRLKQHNMVGVFVLRGWLLKGRFSALSQCLCKGLEGLIFQLLFPPDKSKVMVGMRIVPHTLINSPAGSHPVMEDHGTFRR